MRNLLIITIFLMSGICYSQRAIYPNAVLPDTIFAVENVEINIYYSALIHNYTEYKIKAYDTNNKGKNYARGYRLTPTASEIGVTNLTIEIYDLRNNLLQTVTSKIKVCDNAITGDYDVLLLGNSLTNLSTNSISVVHDSVEANGGTVTCYGQTGVDPYKREGNSGKTYAWYVSSLSPLYDGEKIDVLNYWTSTLGASDTLDFLFIELGINDVWSGTKTESELQTIINDAKTLCDDFIVAFPNIKIMIMMPPICASSGDAWADDYGAASTNSKLQYERNMRNLWRKVVASFDASAYKTNIDVSISGLMIDRDYNYPTTSTAVNSRNVTTYDMQSNAVHPAISGYQQLGDSYYNFFVGKH